MTPTEKHIFGGVLSEFMATNKTQPNERHVKRIETIETIFYAHITS